MAAAIAMADAVVRRDGNGYRVPVLHARAGVAGFRDLLMVLAISFAFAIPAGLLARRRSGGR